VFFDAGMMTQWRIFAEMRGSRYRGLGDSAETKSLVDNMPSGDEVAFWVFSLPKQTFLELAPSQALQSQECKRYTRNRDGLSAWQHVDGRG
jgi:hypothetical protein